MATPASPPVAEARIVDLGSLDLVLDLDERLALLETVARNLEGPGDHRASTGTPVAPSVARAS